MNDAPQLILNGMRTPDGTEIFSRHRHDYVVHKDENGDTYMVDGGNEYLRRSVSPDAEDLSQVFKQGDHQHNRQYQHWGSINQETRAHEYRPIMSLTTDHIKAIINDYDQGRQRLGDTIQYILRQELEYRASIT